MLLYCLLVLSAIDLLRYRILPSCVNTTTVCFRIDYKHNVCLDTAINANDFNLFKQFGRNGCDEPWMTAGRCFKEFSASLYCHEARV